jgi:predicted HAD superfamily Cof-like phosphohydrolase
MSTLSNFRQVREFHQSFGHPCPEQINIQSLIYSNEPNQKLINFRYKLIQEEFNELVQAASDHNMTEVIDALCDLLYVTYGTGVVFGMDLDKMFVKCYSYDDIKKFQIQTTSNFQITMDYYSSSFCLESVSTLTECIEMIKFAFSELKEAFSRGDSVVDIMHAICAVLFETYTAGVAIGIDLDTAFAITHQSNMSKLCQTETEAIDTIEHYKTLKGFETVPVGYRLSPDKNHYVVFNKTDGKILKSKYFKLPDFSGLFN